MQKQLLIAFAVLGTAIIPATVASAQQIKCVDAPLGTDGDPDPDTYCPEDYGHDPRNLSFRDDQVDAARDSRSNNLVDQTAKPEQYAPR